jgi:hypothetical protein
MTRSGSPTIKHNYLIRLRACRGVSLRKELVDLIEEYVEAHPEMGYQSLADFVKDALRDKCDQLGIIMPKPKLPMLEHFNLNGTGVRVLDRSLGNSRIHGRIVDIYFRPNKVFCDFCQSENCNHTQFAPGLPEARAILKEKEWKVKK